MACLRILAHKSPSDACPLFYDPEVMPRLPVVLALCTAAAVTGCGSEGGTSKPSRGDSEEAPKGRTGGRAMMNAWTTTARHLAHRHPGSEHPMNSSCEVPVGGL
jgi:hypothetical protein